MSNKEKDIWKELYNAKLQLEKERIITEFLLELANPKNWECNACNYSIYKCYNTPHYMNNWIGNTNKLPMDKAMEILLKLGEMK